MICCLNPHCLHPTNRDTAKECRSCGRSLIARLRGRYQPVKLIGRGGFGRTYLAYDSDRLNAPCVIKQFAPQTQGRTSFNKAVDLFNQEAVRLHDLGEHAQIPALLAYFEQDQFLYLIQQFIDGKTLIEEMLEQGPLDESGIRRLLHDVLPVLEFIHRHNVIHRDITPTNLVRRDTDRRLFVIDFGIAKQFGATLATGPGTRIGTEGYAPIEQLRGGQAYPCSDLYSLGATCMHLFTGRKPENLYDPMKGRWLWRETLASQNRTVSLELGTVMDRLVVDAVSDRFQTASEVMEALKDLPIFQGTVPGWVRQHSADRRSPDSGLPQGASVIQVRESSVPPTSLPSSPAKLPQSNPPPPPPPSFSRPHSGHELTVSARPLSASRSADVGDWQCARVLTGHQSWVTTVAFSPRAATLVSGSLDDSIKVWDVQSGTALSTLEAHPRGVNNVQISHKGQILVSCGDDSTVKIWNLIAGRVIHTLKGHVKDVTSVSIGCKGWTVASGSKDRSIKLWKLDTGTPVQTLTGTPSAVRSVVIAPNEASVFSGGLDHKVRLWDLQTGAIARVFAGHTGSVNQVAISQDGLLIASASKDRTVVLWSVGTGAVVHTLRGHTHGVTSVAIAPDGRTVISGSTDRTVKLWDAKTGALRHTLTGHSSAVTAISIHRTGRFIASASADKTIRVWKRY